jgi:DDE superfamily endonuclease/Helix-turn-helix of DDE superfamily endonuclease
MNTTHIFKNKRLIKALTGVSEQEFKSLLPVFEQSVLEDSRIRSTATQRSFGGGAKGKIGTTEQKLFFILVYIKTYPTFDFLGFVFSMHNTIKLTKSLEKTLGRKIVMPDKKISSMEEFLEKFPEAKDLFVDGVERPIQRPKNQKRQSKLYSGKKKRHTKKSVIVVDEKKKILVLTETKSGRRHDKRLADKNSLFEHVPESVTLWTDTGFQGILKQHANTLIPKKPTRNKPLTISEKEENRVISSFRVVVEHAISGIKRFKAYSDIWRNKIQSLDDRVMRIVAGLWNLHIEMTA